MKLNQLIHLASLILTAVDGFFTEEMIKTSSKNCFERLLEPGENPEEILEYIFYTNVDVPKHL